MENTDYLEKYGLFDANAPRYTSYPTAPHFQPQTATAGHVKWIRAIGANAQISLYVHVPFCRRLCWFCACRTMGTQKIDPLENYLETLQTELRMLAEDLPEGVTLSRLHWGGGTPTLLPPEMIETLAGSIFEAVPLGPKAEFSVEIDPNEIDPARVAALKAAGMNRASIGVQDFDPDIQKAIGREQSFTTTKRAVTLLRDAGIESLNADILYGLPHQNDARIAASVDKLLSLKPDRVALYGYAHVPWMAKRQRLIPEGALPAARARLQLFNIAHEKFTDAGYDSIGIDHFALPEDGLARAQKAGTLRRNFQGYTDDPADVLIGVGASSISRFPQGYSQNAPATAAYTQAIREERYATSRGHAFRHDDLLRARLIEKLMCDFRVDSRAIAEELKTDPALIQQLLTPLAQTFDPLLQLDENGLSIPPEARPLTRLVAKEIDAYDGNGARHSIAV